MSTVNSDRTLALVYENTKEILSILKSKQVLDVSTPVRNPSEN